MGTPAIVHLDGEILCFTGYDGHPYKLGEDLAQTSTNWKSVLQLCKEYGILVVNTKYWILDPEFVYSCFSERWQERYPELIDPQYINEFKKGNDDIISECSEFEVLLLWTNKPYKPYFYMDEVYQYNHYENQVFVRLPYTNFPWVLINDLGDLFSDKILEDILFDMLGVLNYSEVDEDLWKHAHDVGAVSSGRHFILASKRATEILLDDPNSWWNYGKSLELMNKYPLAIEAYLEAKNLTPNNPIIWRLLSKVYLKNNQIEESKKYLNNPQIPLLLYQE